jgi:thiaminase/transcriptional activator TenA
MTTSADLVARAAELWSAATDHPFVDGIRTGSLPQKTFAYYLAQDYVFLVGYCRVFGLAAAKAPDLDTMGFLDASSHCSFADCRV